MWQYILIGLYCFLSGLLVAALLTDKNCNTNNKETVFCVAAGLLWPLAIGIAAGFGLYDNIKEKIKVKQRARNSKILSLSLFLHKLKVISKDTLYAVQARML